MTKPVSRTVHLGGSVHYVDYGGPADRGTLVLVHGLGGSVANWCAVGERLAEHHRVYAIDLVGFGRSRLEGRGADVDSNAELVLRFIRDVVGGPATLVGNSMGGAISLLAAAKSPADVRSLVLVNAALPRTRGAALDPQVALVFATYMVPWLGERALASFAARLTSQQHVDQMMRLCAADSRKLDAAHVAEHVAIADERRGWTDEGHASFLEAARSLIRAMTLTRLAKAMKKIAVPTLVIHGDRDRLVNVANGRGAAKAHGWDLEVFEGVGHIPQLEVPAKFVDVIETWLERAKDGAAGAVSKAS